MSLRVWLPLNGDARNQGLINSVPVVNGGTWDNGKIGKCYNGGGTGWINLNSTITLNSAFTIALWLKVNSFNAAWARVFGFYKNGNEYCGMCYSNTNSVGFHIYDDVNGTKTKVYDAYRYHPVIGEWAHIAIVFNGSSTIQWFKDGDLIYTENNITLPVNNSYSINGLCTIGNGGNKSDCSINDFRLYDTALSENEIRRLSRGLVMHYSLSGSGGENLIVTNSMTPLSGTAGWSHAGTGWAISNVVSAEASNGRAIRCTYSGTTQTQGGIHHPTGVDKTTLTNGGTYTVSARIRASKNCIATFDNELMGINNLINLTPEWQTYSFSHTIDTSRNYQSNVIYVRAQDVEKNMWIECDWFKLEEGAKATPWVPNSASSLFTIMGFNNNIEYDLSGNGYNGMKNNVVGYGDGPKNNGCYQFNGSNSYIKCESTQWMVQGSEAMTVNWWAYSSDWSAVTNGGRMISCTEGGGWNIEGGSSGYLKFPINVYTNADKTSHGYQSNANAVKLSSLTPGWHMFTLVRTTTQEKVYIDGELHSQASYTSYGLYYNTSARFFIGCEANAANAYTPYFNGRMSDFRLYYTALSADDILELYKTPESLIGGD